MNGWRMLERMSEELYILCRNQENRTQYAPLYVHRFDLRNTTGYGGLRTVPERLRWLRHSRGLMQSEAAVQIGVSLHGYKAMEEGTVQHISKETADRLARFYQVPVTDLLDEYSLFLCDGQAQRIQTMRKALGMNQRQFAKYLGIPTARLRKWEAEETRISKTCWERYFRGKA